MSEQHYNGLTPAETERLDIMQEECAEIIQAISKIKRHGYESFNPFDTDRTTNRSSLSKEIGHLAFALRLARCHGDINGNINGNEIEAGGQEKEDTISQWLHHNVVPKRKEQPTLTERLRATLGAEAGTSVDDMLAAVEGLREKVSNG